MSGSYDLHLAHIRALGDTAVRMLETDPLLNVRAAAAAVGVVESSVYRAWRRAHPGRPPRGRGRITPQMCKAAAAPFAKLCDVMLDHVPFGEPARACEIFEAVRQVAANGSRRLFRALRRLVDTQRIERVGEIYSSTYRRFPMAPVAVEIDLQALKRTALAAHQDEWQWQDDGDAIEGVSDGQIVLYVDEDEDSDGPVVVASPLDRAHIAAASPPVVLALIERIEKLEEAMSRAVDMVAYDAANHDTGTDPRFTEELRAVLAKGVVLS